MKIFDKFRNNKFFRNFLIYLTSGGVSKVIPMLILLVIAKYLSPKEFGLISNFGVIVNLFGAMSSMKLGKIVQAEYFDQSEQERKSHVSNLIYLMSLLTTSLIFISIFLETLFLDLLRLDFKWVIVGALVGLFVNVFDIRTIVLRMSEKPKSFAYFQIGNSILVAVLNILFIVVLKWSWEGRILATFFSSIIMFLITILFLYQQGWFPKRFSLQIIKKYLFIGIPLTPMALSPFINSNVAKVILTKEIGLSANGIYSLGLTITTMVQLLIIAYFNTYVPVLYKKLGVSMTSSKKIIFNDILRALPFLAVTLIVVYIVAMVFINVFLDEKYGETTSYLSLFFLRLFLFSIFSFLSYFLLFYKEIKFISFMAIGTATLNVILSLILIPRYEIYGAVISLIIILILKIIVTYFFISKTSLTNTKL